jgi:hypothetical protein
MLIRLVYEADVLLKCSGTALLLLILTNPSEFSILVFHLFISTLPSFFSISALRNYCDCQTK